MAGELLLQGPVFIKEPSNSIFPVGSEDKKITLNCEARGNPSPHYRWQLNGSDINLSMGYRYKLNGGNLVVINPNRNWDTGSYQCFATNSVGTIVSREAKLQFAYHVMWSAQSSSASVEDAVSNSPEELTIVCPGEDVVEGVACSLYQQNPLYGNV
ncbi:hypothetical protein J1605_005477 [Eschrichtius robustus]|uniref:Ig-like domain-containing protein n=1 Tax=Eschrichtius robustus TaxID=9764 RepID=A0AB34H7G0_ESCRO|nr:hypothetical protein J1605_005477 [Eschrichtius robustus]